MVEDLPESAECPIPCRSVDAVPKPETSRLDF